MTTTADLYVLPGATLREGLDNLGQPLASVTRIRPTSHVGRYLHEATAAKHDHRIDYCPSCDHLEYPLIAKHVAGVSA
jgi:hypothetical protein